MATNRQDTLDPALLRPGRLDRKIEFPMPSRRERRLIFQTVTGPMNLGPDVDLEDCEFKLACIRDMNQGCNADTPQISRGRTVSVPQRSHPSVKLPDSRVSLRSLNGCDA